MLEWWNGGTVDRRNSGTAENQPKRGKAEIRSIALKAGGQKKIVKKGDMKK